MEPTQSQQPIVQPTVQSVPPVTGQTSSNFLVIILSLLLVGAIVSTAYFYYKSEEYKALVSQQNAESTQALSEVADKANTDTVNSTTSIQPELFVDPKTAKVGDVVGALTIKTIKGVPYPDGSFESLYIDFGGEITVEGKMGYNEMQGMPCILLSKEGGLALPEIKVGENVDKYFCLRGDVVKTLPVDLQTYNPSVTNQSYTVSVTVKDYRFVTAPKEVVSLATLVKVNSIQVLKGE
jgi:hypothetical protein